MAGNALGVKEYLDGLAGESDIEQFLCQCERRAVIAALDLIEAHSRLGPLTVLIWVLRKREDNWSLKLLKQLAARSWDFLEWAII